MQRYAVCCHLVISKDRCVQLHNVIIILKPLISSKRLITDKKTLSMSMMESKKCKWCSREGVLLTQHCNDNQSPMCIGSAANYGRAVKRILFRFMLRETPLRAKK